MMIHPILQKLIADPSINYFKSQPAKEQRKLWADRIATFYSSSIKPEIKHTELAIPTRNNQMDGRLFTPKQHSKNIILFLHGGGWSLGSINTYQLVCDYLADESKCQVLSIDYRLAPEHKFPAALDDAVDAYHWLVKNALSLNAQPDQITVIGDSAGGNLTAVLSHLTKNELIKPKAQVLWYPAVDADYNYPSKKAYTDSSYMLDRQWLEWFYSNYARSEADRYLPEFSPIYFDGFNHMPPALIILPELDPLHDEGVAYSEKLKEHGNEVTVTTYKQMVHGFIGYIGVIEASLKAIKETSQWLNDL
ncbi:alpha/beta hydrolase [Thiotrichales bacterium 19S3-7]|nr:alpha/beta hydrolase [Thiotrichales bacterium 19S3-7]MCF6802021.1 alpha/beta hydrolase [Thiotrichales bacterium 19S3-11]